MTTLPAADTNSYWIRPHPEYMNGLAEPATIGKKRRALRRPVSRTLSDVVSEISMTQNNVVQIAVV